MSYDTIAPVSTMVLFMRALAGGTTRNLGNVWFQVDQNGQKVFDLAAVAQAAGSATIHLNRVNVHQLSVSLSEVLAVGEADIISGTSKVTITGDARDIVQLRGDGGWSLAGTTTDGAETYMVYFNQNAQLLLNEKIHTIIA